MSATKGRRAVQMPNKNISFVEPITLHQSGSPPVSPRPAAISRRRKKASRPNARVLDGFVLIRAAGATDPRDVHEANISNKGLRCVNQEDLSFFTELVAIDADDNQLSLDCLSSLPLLELRMRCNSLQSVRFSPGGFRSLQVLDISFNRVDPESIGDLGQMSNLRELSLANNHLTWLPDGIANLGALTVLDLEGNSITSSQSVVALSQMQRLQTLNLSANGLLKWHTTPLGGFASLRELSISRNSIEDIHDIRGLGKVYMPLLTTLVMWGNPMCDGLSGEEIDSLQSHIAANARIEAVDPLSSGPPSSVHREVERKASALPSRMYRTNTLGDFARTAEQLATTQAAPNVGHSHCSKNVFSELRAALMSTESSASCFTGRRPPSYMNAKSNRVKTERTLSPRSPEAEKESRGLRIDLCPYHDRSREQAQKANK